ncbi:MAG: glycosyltransferase [archaeon]
MKVCYAPTYDSEYSRVKIIKQSLIDNGVEIIDCSSKNNTVIGRGIGAFFKLLKNKSKCDVILFGFFGQPLVPLIRPFTKKKIVLDAFMSTYNTYVEDKKKVKKGGLLSKFLFYMDKVSCEKSDLILLENDIHILYFCKTFGIKRDKFSSALVGADQSLFYPKPSKTNKRFTVEFHGLFIPLQGVEYIVEAAHILKDEDILFKMVGNGQTFDASVALANKLGLKNMKFEGRKPLEEMPNYISGADVGLGIFGETKKTQFVIPNKAYEIMAMGKPCITADTPAIREILVNKKSAMLCPAKDSKALAKAILELKNNKELRDKIAKEGYKVFQEQCTYKQIGKKLKKDMKKLIEVKK